MTLTIVVLKILSICRPKLLKIMLRVLGYPQRDTSRPRDRYAPPVRAAPALERGRIAPKHNMELDRDRASVGKERPKEYELPRVVGRPPPLLGTGPPKPSLPIKSGPIPRPTVDDTMAR